MVFSLLHWLPSAIAAIFTIALVFVKKPYHKTLGMGMTIFALLGLLGFATSGSYSELSILSIHSIHAWIGLAALISALALFIYNTNSKKKVMKHYKLGYFAAALAALSLLLGILLFTGTIQPSVSYGGIQYPVSNALPEIEATQFNGIALVPLSQQGNNAIKGTQYIDKTSYRLHVYGLVDKELNMSYDELLALPAYSEASYMPCVEGWGFMAKWTGFRISDLLDKAELKPDAAYVVFYSSDGYSTGLNLSYVKEKNVLMAYGINDVTLPAERGFPFQVVADSKYGYKWAKWVVAIEVVNQTQLGYWESGGYSETANAGGLPFG